MPHKGFLEHLSAFLLLKPLCDLRFLQVTWIVFLLVEVATALNLIYGTSQAYPRFGFALLVVTAPALLWLFLRLAIVRILLEVAAVVLQGSTRTGDPQETR